MKQIIVWFVAILIAVFVGMSISYAEARQVSVNFNWLYEAAKMPVGYTVDQAYGNTSKLNLYQSNDMGVTWIKIGEYPMAGFPLPAPTMGWPINFNIELAEGAQYLLHFSMTGVNKLDQESVKSNVLPVAIDLRIIPTVPPTIKTITYTIVLP
jgi:hypothetical protein